MGLNVQSIVLLGIGLVVIAAVVPNALTTINDTNTTGWDAGQIALFGVIGIAALAGIVIGLLKKGRS